MTDRQEDNLNSFRKWIMPILLSVIAFLIAIGINTITIILNEQSNKLDGLENSMILLNYKVQELQDDSTSATMERGKMNNDISDMKNDIRYIKKKLGE